MFTQAQIEYIQRQYSRGLNADAISNKLIEAGWEKGDIKDGLEEVARLASLPINKVSLPSQPLNPPIVAANAQTPQPEVYKIDNYNPAPANNILNIENRGPVPPTLQPKEDEHFFPNANKSHSAKGIVKVILITIIILLILGGAAFAYYEFIYKPSLDKSLELDANATITDNVPIPEQIPPDYYSDQVITAPPDQVPEYEPTNPAQTNLGQQDQYQSETSPTLSPPTIQQATSARPL